MRAGLVLLAVIHVACAWLTTARSKRARAERYRRPLRGSESTISSRSMRWGGLFVLLFLVYHVLHIFGPLHASYVAGDVYHNVVAGMSDPLAGAVYVAATIVFGLHLHHGAQSSIRSLGYEGVLSPTVRRVGIVATVVITIGFLAPVAAAMSGMLAA
jgi:succinate dehydrogenase / fumarate reductase cytochrome b subunit